MEIFYLLVSKLYYHDFVERRLKKKLVLLQEVLKGIKIVYITSKPKYLTILNVRQRKFGARLKSESFGSNEDLGFHDLKPL